MPITIRATAHPPGPNGSTLADARRIKILAIELKRTLRSLIAEAFNDLLVKYGKRPIATTDDDSTVSR